MSQPRGAEETVWRPMERAPQTPMRQAEAGMPLHAPMPRLYLHGPALLDGGRTPMASSVRRWTMDERPL